MKNQRKRLSGSFFVYVSKRYVKVLQQFGKEVKLIAKFPYTNENLEEQKRLANLIGNIDNLIDICEQHLDSMGESSIAYVVAQNVYTEAVGFPREKITNCEIENRDPMAEYRRNIDEFNKKFSEEIKIENSVEEKDVDETEKSTESLGIDFLDVSQIRLTSGKTFALVDDNHLEKPLVSLPVETHHLYNKSKPNHFAGSQLHILNKRLEQMKSLKDLELKKPKAQRFEIEQINNTIARLKKWIKELE